MLVLTSSLWISSRASVDAANLDLVISNDCRIEFLPSNVSNITPLALSLDKQRWDGLSSKCNETWSTELTEMSTVVLINKGKPAQAVDNLRNLSLSENQHLKLVVLFGYAADPQAKLAQFCSLLSDEELKGQCFSDTWKRMAIFNTLQDVEVLPFWFHLVRNEFRISEDLLETANASMQSVVAGISEGIHDGCVESEQRCLQFVSLEKEVRRFYIPKVIEAFFKKGHATKELFTYTNQMLPDLACFVFNQIYLTMKIYNQLDTVDALELRVTIQGSKSRVDQALCVDTERALLEHTPAQVEVFLQQSWDKSEFEKLQTNKLTVAILSEIIEARYGRGNSTKALIEFFWRWDAPTEIACVGSLALVLQMQRSGHLESLEALALFLRVNKHRISYTDEFSWSKSCTSVQEYAPDLVKSFLYQDKSCECCKSNSKQCLQSTMNNLDSIIKVDSTNLAEENPREVLFIGYVFHSFKTGNLSQEFQHEIFVRETNLQVTSEAVQNALVSYFLLDDDATLYLSVDSLENWFNKDAYAYILDRVIKKAYARCGISKMATFLYQSEYVVDLGLKCNMFDTLFKAMERDSEIDNTPAFALWLFIESYVLNKFRNNSYKDMRTSCEEVELKLRNTTSEHLDDYFTSWNDPSLLSRIIKWHDDFRFSSAWVLPKLVRHVFLERNETTAKSLIDFFGDLVTKSETLENFDLCAGLHELMFQMKKSGDLANKNLTLAVENLFPQPLRPNHYLVRMQDVLYGICQAAFVNLVH
jgi:hypothetical protein